MSKHQSSQIDTVSEPKDRYATGRRRLLQSLAVGGAAVTVKALPEKWAKPVLETTLIPAHADNSPVPLTLSCEIGGFEAASDSPFMMSFTSSLTGGQTGTVWPNLPTFLPTTWTITDINAWTDPVAAPISLSVTAANNATLDLGALATIPNAAPGTNTTDFGVVEVAMAAEATNTLDTGTVDFTFSADGATCQIDVVFLEFGLGGP